jgi:hypothetical protein
VSKTTTPAGNAAGRPALLQAGELRVLVELTQHMPQASMDELTRAFAQETGIDVCSATIGKALKKAGVKRVRAPRRAAEGAANLPRTSAAISSTPACTSCESAVSGGFCRATLRLGAARCTRSFGPGLAQAFSRTCTTSRGARRFIAHHDRSNWAPVAWAWLAEMRILATRLVTWIHFRYIL